MGHPPDSFTQIPCPRDVCNANVPRTWYLGKWATPRTRLPISHNGRRVTRNVPRTMLLENVVLGMFAMQTSRGQCCSKSLYSALCPKGSEDVVFGQMGALGRIQRLLLTLSSGCLHCKRPEDNVFQEHCPRDVSSHSAPIMRNG